MLSVSSPVSLLGLSILYCAYASKGIDVSVFLYNYFDFKDYVLEGCSDFAVFQGYRNNGSVNLNDSDESRTAGYKNFDLYMSPCPRCNKSASQQVLEMGKPHPLRLAYTVHYQIIPPPQTTIFYIVTVLNETMVEYTYCRIWIEIHVRSLILILPIAQAID